MKMRMLFNNLVNTVPQAREVFELLKEQTRKGKTVRVVVSSWDDGSLKPEGQVELESLCGGGSRETAPLASS